MTANELIARVRELVRERAELVNDPKADAPEYGRDLMWLHTGYCVELGGLAEPLAAALETALAEIEKLKAFERARWERVPEAMRPKRDAIGYRMHNESADLCPPGTCANCGETGPHYVPPSLGESGFYICKPKEKPC